MSARFLMIALDGADGTLLDRWSADGTLPRLEALRAGGSVARLSAPAGVTDDGLWASFQFAAPLGAHGRYHWEQRLASGELGMTFTDEADRVAFWDLLSDEGLRVAVFDVPKCGAPRPLKGIHLVDWLVHGRYFREPRSFPEELADEVVEKFGPAPPSHCAYEGPPLDDDQVGEVVENLRTSVARKRAAGLHYLASEPWDLFVIGFKEAHCAGHHLWDFIDHRHPDYDVARVTKLGDPVRTLFRDLDSAVGELIDAAGPDTVVAAFSSSDMEPNGTLIHLMPVIARAMNRAVGETWWTRAARRVRNRLTGKRSGPPFEILPYNENCAALRVNPEHGLLGIRGDDRRRSEMIRTAEAILGELVDADTGARAVAGVDRPSMERAGARTHLLPDLLVRYASGVVPRAVASPRLGRIEAGPPPVRPGNHAAGGFVILAGAAAEGVTGMEDFGSLALRVLQVEA